MTEAKKNKRSDKSSADDFLDDLLDLEALADSEAMNEDKPGLKVSLAKEKEAAVIQTMQTLSLSRRSSSSSRSR